MGSPRQEFWNGWPFPSPGNLPEPGTEPTSPALQADSSPLRSPHCFVTAPFLLSTHRELGDIYFAVRIFLGKTVFISQYFLRKIAFIKLSFMKKAICFSYVWSHLIFATVTWLREIDFLRLQGKSLTESVVNPSLSNSCLWLYVVYCLPRTWGLVGTRCWQATQDIQGLVCLKL